MKRPLIYTGRIILIFTLFFVMGLIYDNHLHKEKNLREPNVISSYWDKSYYKISPETILESLESGGPNVFIPLLEDPQDIEELTDITIRWTQADILKIAAALGKFMWNDPMDLHDWKVYSIAFDGLCENPIGFYYAKITYFKTETFSYTTRLIEIHPYLGWVRGGDGNVYPKPVFQKWKSVDLLGAKISADDAIGIVSEDAKERFDVKNSCSVRMGSPGNNNPHNWYLHIFTGLYIVNLETGNYTFQKLIE